MSFLGALLAPGSPRLHDGKKATLSNLGSLVPRPQKAAEQAPPAPSPRLNVAQSDTRLPGACKGGGVVPKLKLRQAEPGAAGVAAHSPRKCLTARDPQRPVTLGQLGAMLPRPAQQVASTPRTARLSPQTTFRETTPVSADVRSGVVYERDGFELFYEIEGSEDKHKMKAPREKRDAYDKFYGIRSSDRRPPPASARLPTRAATSDEGASAVATALEQARLQRSADDSAVDAMRARRCTAPPEVPAAWAVQRPPSDAAGESTATEQAMASSLPAREAASNEESGEVDPNAGEAPRASRATSGAFKVIAPARPATREKVVEYSLATPACPAPSFSAATVPRGVEVFCLTPSHPSAHPVQS